MGKSDTSRLPLHQINCFFTALYRTCGALGGQLEYGSWLRWSLSMRSSAKFQPTFLDMTATQNSATLATMRKLCHWVFQGHMREPCVDEAESRLLDHECGGIN